MQLALGDKVIQVLQRYGMNISRTLAERIHAICHPSVPDLRVLQTLMGNYLKTGDGEPLSDFMCRIGLSMEEFKKFASPKAMAFHGALDKRDFSRMSAQDVNSPRIRACFETMDNEKVAALIGELKEIVPRDWQIRFIFGYGASEWSELKQALRATHQSGDDDRLPWSKAKHLASVEFIRQATNNGLLPAPPLVFEACQGKGDATLKYRQLGVVIAAESDRTRYEYAYQKTNSMPLASLNLHERQPGQVFMPDKPLSAQEAVDRLNLMGVRFDVVDIDPFGSSLNLLLACIPILQKRTLVMLTLGDAANPPHGFDTVSSGLGMDLSSLPESRRGYIKDRLSLVVAYKYLEQAADAGLYLHPLLYFKAVQYHRYRVTLEGKRGKPVAGVDRLYCVAVKDVDPKHVRKAVRGYSVNDPWVGRPMLWPGLDAPFAMIDFYQDLWDLDKNCLSQAGLSVMSDRIAQACRHVLLPR